MKTKFKNFKGSWLQIILGFGIPLLFILINSFFIVGNLGINAIPIDDSLSSEDYANLFSAILFNAAVWCMIINFLIVIFMCFLNMNSRIMWVVFLLINVAVGSVYMYMFNSDYPADSNSFVTTMFMFVGMYLLSYLIASVATCNDYKHFSPIAKFVRK